MSDMLELEAGVRALQAMVPMRDGARLNTFVFLPPGHGSTFPAIMQRTPYGIVGPDAASKTDISNAWLPAAEEPLRGSLLRGWKNITARGYAAIYQDTRGRFASEGEDRVYADDANDGWDTLEWLAKQPWSNGKVGVSGSSAGATTAYAAASTRHPSLRAFFAQVGGSSIYDDVVYEGNSIEMERLWLWVAKNIPGLSRSHREAARTRAGLTEAEMDEAATRALDRYHTLDAARHADVPYVNSPAWMHLPLLNYPDFATWQPFLDTILSQPAPNAFRDRHSFRRTIEIPGFHATTWYDIFLTSVLGAFSEIQARVGNQRLWIGPNGHYFIYEEQFWPRDPYFEWFDHWLKGEDTAIVHEPAVHYSPRAWVDDPVGYSANDWQRSDRWPPPQARPMRLCLTAAGALDSDPGADGERSYLYDPRDPVPTLGGRNMSIEPGQLDQRPAERHANYGLTYLGEPLERSLTLAGPVSVSLVCSSDCPDTDFVAKLVQVGPDGEARLLMDGIVRAMLRDGPDPKRLQSGEPVRVHVPLGHIHHVVRAGCRLRVDVSSSNFPRRIRNTNSGNLDLPRDTEQDIRIARNALHHGCHNAPNVSFLVAPTT